jgi:hypothetical protein
MRRGIHSSASVEVRAVAAVFGEDSDNDTIQQEKSHSTKGEKSRHNTKGEKPIVHFRRNCPRSQRQS